MASRKPSGHSSLLMLVLVTAGPGIVPLPALLDCAPALSRNDDDSAFRANVLLLLAALPSAAAAAAPTGFAATPYGCRNSAFARGPCFGLGAGRGSPFSSLGDFPGTEADSRRAAAWRAVCLLSYADTNTSSAREDAFRGWFYMNGGGAREPMRGRPHDGGVLPVQCINDSALVVPALVVVQGRKLSRVRWHAVVVVGYGCYLRVALFAPALRWMGYDVGFFEVCGLLFCIKKSREMNPA
ncbi:hypothetical protein PAHAL_9G596300 [Panicum hallii]|uniref:Uncharacterized protein n=1 Tax=Panicum hallii TaxID=206008 RepID=A0A2T8I6A6_9POAL|nr:hypothetical protein PAHAL_9G596300 [Panicum hallii]